MIWYRLKDAENHWGENKLHILYLEWGIWFTTYVCFWFALKEIQIQPGMRSNPNCPWKSLVLSDLPLTSLFRWEHLYHSFDLLYTKMPLEIISTTYIWMSLRSRTLATFQWMICSWTLRSQKWQKMGTSSCRYLTSLSIRWGKKLNIPFTHHV